MMNEGCDSHDAMPVLVGADDVSVDRQGRQSPEADDPKADLDGLIERARADTTIGNSLVRGINIRYQDA